MIDQVHGAGGYQPVLFKGYPGFLWGQSRARLAWHMRWGHCSLTADLLEGPPTGAYFPSWKWSSPGFLQLGFLLTLFSRFQPLLSFCPLLHLPLGGLSSTSGALGCDLQGTKDDGIMIWFPLLSYIPNSVGYFNPDALLSSQIPTKFSRIELIFFLKVPISVHETTILSAKESGNLFVTFVSSNSNHCLSHIQYFLNNVSVFFSSLCHSSV